MEVNEREIVHWESRTAETQRAALELNMCVELVEKIGKVWPTSLDEEKQPIIRMLFDAVIFDLDAQRIVNLSSTQFLKTSV